jgi:hypothetical protein
VEDGIDMGNKKSNIQRLFLLNGVLLSCLFSLTPTCSSIDSFILLDSNTSTNSTDLKVTSVEIDYQISFTGTYECKFTLHALGNNLTASGSAEAILTVKGELIDNFELMISETAVSFQETDLDNSSVILVSFANHSFPSGFPFTISGSYTGKYQTRTPDTYTFVLGIDWGTTVGSQQTMVQFADTYSLILPIEGNPMISKDPGVYTLSWYAMMTQGFVTSFQLHPRIIPTFLVIDFPSIWNATIGKPQA